MPARDPATSPHISQSIHAGSPVLPTHVHPGHHRPSLASPSSSAWSSRSANGPGAAAGGSGAEAEYGSLDKDGPPFLQSLLRRVSGDHAAAGPSQIRWDDREEVEGRDYATGQGSGGTTGNELGHSKRPQSGSGFDHRSISPTSSSALSTSSHEIRNSTNRLASLSFTVDRRRSVSNSSSGPSQAPSSGTTIYHDASTSPGVGFRPEGPVSPRTHRTGYSFSAGGSHRPSQPSHLNPAVSGIVEDISPPSNAPSRVGSAGVGRSGLTVMMEREHERRAKAKRDDEADAERTPIARPAHLVRTNSDSPTDPSLASGEATPRGHRGSLAAETVMDSRLSDTASDISEHGNSSALRRFLEGQVGEDEAAAADERTTLLPNGDGDHKRPGAFSRLGEEVRHLRQRAGKVTTRDVVRACIEEPVKTLPSVILGCLLNVLDGVSYGMILFPANSYFVDFGSLGVSMFFVSCIVSQLVFTLGGSIFPGGNGSMMIEAVPFFHILINIIEAEVGDDDASIIATTMVSFAFSSVLTGLIFFALGAFKLGGLIGYFPRHILVGCIGGVGIFLIETGLEVSRGLKEEGFDYSLATLRLFFESPHAIILWTLPLVLAIFLRVITHFFHHQLIFPAYFFLIPIIFYIVIAIGGWSFADLRTWGWVFDVGAKSQAWWKFYTLFDFKKTNWAAFWAAMPTQLALVFFGILHVPLNVPALGVTLGEDNVKLDRELIAHGFSNLAAGVTGTVPNYLTYVNTVLFYRVGGGSRLSGVMLAVATTAILFVGPSVIGYLPVPLVGALIYVLGIDLLIEAVWDTRSRVNRSEYITIWAIAIGMTVWDFVIGLLFGIILACIFFVVQNSRRRPIRVILDGSNAKSTVRRPRSQRAFIQQIGSQTCIMKLHGFLFFGTITAVEAEIRNLLEVAMWQETPIRFLIIDFALVYGLDFSSAEAFVRIQRLLAAKDVLLILCGAKPNGLVGTALQMVDLWADREGTRVEVFTGLGEALEWTENAYLTAFYDNQRQDEEEAKPVPTIDFPKVAKPPFSLSESFAQSPRRAHLAKAGGATLPQPQLSTFFEDTDSEDTISDEQPLPLLIQTFASYPDSPAVPWFAQLVPYLTRQEMHTNQVVWKKGDPATALYLIETGSLRATYDHDHGHERVGAGGIQETMVAGTIAGDLSMLSSTKRNATVVAERDGVLWRLDREALGRMEEEKPEVARELIKLVLKAVAEEHDVLAAHLIAVLS